MEDIEYIEKEISGFYHKKPQRVIFKTLLYSVIKSETTPVE